MNLAAAALFLALIVPGLAQSQAPAPPYLLDAGELPPATPTPGSWPAADGSGIGVRHPSCPTTNPPTYTGPATITANNTRVYNVRIPGGITIAASNVRIECALIENPNGGRGVFVGPGPGAISGTVISKVKISNIGTNTATRQGKGIYNTGYSSNLIVEYSELTDAEDGMHSEGNGVTMSYSWMHDTKYGGDPNLHPDGLTVASGSNYQIRNNRFGPFTVTSSAIMVQPSGSCPSMSNIDIISNYIDGDGVGHTVLSDRSAGCTCPTGMDITNNQFGPNGGPPSGATPVSNGSGDKACVPVTSRGGSCSGNKLYSGSPAGC